MSTVNPFDLLLGDDDNDDPTQLIAVQQQKILSMKTSPPPANPAAAAKMPTKPVPPSQAVREAKSNNAVPRGGGSGRGGPGRGRGGRGGGPGQSRDYVNGNVNQFEGSYGGDVEEGRGKEGDGGRSSDRVRGRYNGPRQNFQEIRPRAGFGNWEAEGDLEESYGGDVKEGRGKEGDGRRPFDRVRGPYDGPRQHFRGVRPHAGFGNWEAGGDLEQSRRTFERRSGTGRGYEMKRDGAGRGNWGTATDDTFAQETEDNVNADEKIASPEKQPEHEAAASAKTGKENKEGQANESDEKEKEAKEMTLEEYEKIREEKRKALVAQKAEERKVVIDKELKSMQQLSVKKGNDPIFIKLGSDKERKKENTDRDERVKKSVSINEFLKPAEGERYRGRGRGRGDRGSFQGGFGGEATATVGPAPPIEDPDQFPTLGGK